MYDDVIIEECITKRFVLSRHRVAVMDIETGLYRSYQELNERSDHLAACLQATGRLTPGDSVWVLAEPCPEFFDLYYAAGKTGFVPVFPDESIEQQTMIEWLRATDATVLCYSHQWDSFVEKLKEAVPEICCISLENPSASISVSQFSIQPVSQRKLEDVFIRSLASEEDIHYQMLCFNSITQVAAYHLTAEFRFYCKTIPRMNLWIDGISATLLAGGTVVIGSDSPDTHLPHFSEYCESRQQAAHHLMTSFCQICFRQAPHNTAIFDHDSQTAYTYGYLDQRSNRLANYFRDNLGLKKGDRIGVCSRNRIELFELFFAAYKTGVILSTYNGRLFAAEIEEMIQNERPAALFFEDILVEKVQYISQNNTGIKHCIVFGNKIMTPATACYADVDTYPPQWTVPKEIGLEDTLMLMHTGGTTGRSKAANISYRSILFNAFSQILTYGLHPKEKTYLFHPLFHSAGWSSVSIGLLLAGGQLVIKKKFSAEDTLKIIQDEHLTYFLAVPVTFHRMVASKLFETADFSSLKKIRCGAAPLETNFVKNTFWERGLPLCNAYGMTEAGPSNLTFPVDEISIDTLQKKLASVGMPMFFNWVKLLPLGPDGTENGNMGELLFRGPLLFSGYWNNEAETMAAVQDGWLHTGDIARRDEDGYYYIAGRRKNMYISCGENIYPNEIEDVLLKCAGIHDVCVIGVPDPEWGEAGAALIELEPGSSLDEHGLRDYMWDNLSHIKVPKHIRIVDRIPRNAVGKLLQKEARKYFLLDRNSNQGGVFV